MSDSDAEMKKVEDERRHDHNSRSLDKIEFQLASMAKDLAKILGRMEQISADHTAFLLWKQSIEARLKDGERIMDEAKAAADEDALDKRYIKKETVKYLAAGFLAAGGVGGALGHELMRFLGRG